MPPSPAQRRPVLRLVAASAVVAAGLLVLPVAEAGAGDPLRLVADTTQAGRIALRVVGDPGSQVQYAELVGDWREPLGTLTLPASGDAPLPQAVSWRCERLDRTFVADGYGPDGAPISTSVTVRTPSCASRLEVEAPARVTRGRLLTVLLRDRWDLGDLAATVCASGAGVGYRCAVSVPRATGTRAIRVRARRSGRLRIAIGYAARHRVVVVAVRAPRG